MKDLPRVRVPGPLAPHRDGLWTHLRERGYTPLSARNLMRVTAHLSRWLDEQRLRTDQLRAPRLERYLQHRRDAGYVGWRSMRGLEPILEYLRGVGVVPPAPVVSDAPSPMGDLLARYGQHLESERGLTLGVIARYERCARAFLLAHVDSDLSGLAAAAVVAYARMETESCSPGHARGKLAALRSLLRFLHLAGDLPRDLTGAVPSVAGAPRSGLPRGADPDHVRKLVRGFDRRTHVGRRNHAIVLLLARLGLRRSEVAALEFDDIDWARGTCVIRGKGGREDCLPLPDDVGQAIVSYLRRGRPRTSSRRVFIQACAPHRDITGGAITYIVSSAAKRLGLPNISPHRLRHTAATEMLRRGASLPEIAQVLRHRHLATTAIYAKVDRDALRPLGRPWPGGVR